MQQEYRFKHNKEYDIDFDNAIVEKWFLDLLLMRCVVCDPVIPFGKVNEQEYGKQTIVDYGTVATLRAHLNVSTISRFVSCVLVKVECFHMNSNCIFSQ